MRIHSVILSLSLLAGSCYANPLSINAPIEISSDTQQVNIKKNTIVFFGNVKVTQGTLVILADSIEVQQLSSNNQQSLIAKGNPARYQQLMPNLKQATAEADEIHYSLKNKIIYLKGHAKIHQNNSHIQSDEISYHLHTQKILAKSQSEQRVITIIDNELQLKQGAK
jgi:lipopolysaccharide export system protein LptA